MEPHEEFEQFEKDMQETREITRKAIIDSLNKNCDDWASASAWSAYSLDNLTEGNESPENESLPVEEVVLLELGKLQWINMQILNQLRELNSKR